jgi:putative transcriptional regulator
MGQVVEAQKQGVEPAKGVFLVAKPGMAGTFKESVILLLAHTKEDGTLGVIINRTTDVTLQDALPDLEVKGTPKHRLFFGGPVEMNALIVVFRTGNPPEGAPHVMWDVYFSGERDVLEELLRRKKGVNEMHVFMGYAGWGPGQLQWEIGRGDWEVVRGDRKKIFEEEPELIWPELMGPVTQQIAD